MGAWGTGLYANDTAADLKSTIGAVTRLPCDAERIVEILCETQSEEANDPENEDYTTFWLVLADQFHKRGIENSGVIQKALAIIDSGSDLAMMESLEMTPGDLKKRKKVLDALRDTLKSPPPKAKTRSVLKNPQKLVMEVGEVLIYPTSKGQPLNPYCTYEQNQKSFGWEQNGWGAIVIVECGLAFEYLAWYRFLGVEGALKEKPNLGDLQKRMWDLCVPGTCSAAAYKRMQLEKIGNLSIDMKKLKKRFKGMSSPIDAAVHDINIANMHIESASMGVPRFDRCNLSDVARGK
jgi:hypothetical protein